MSRKAKEAMKPSEMFLTVKEAMRLLCSLSEAKKMKEDMRRQKLIAGAFVGGLVGSLVPGSLGLAVAFWLHWRQFKPVSQILMKLPQAEQEELPSKVMAIVRHLGWTDIGELIMLVMGNEAMWKPLLELLMSYIKKKP